MQLISDGSVSCEFVRQRCTHESLFQPFYKRSNRTKGSKILRCFPHCCPNHAHRGFCGSSLHVRVQWNQRPLDRGAPPPTIHVFGRFRLSDTPAFADGQSLPAASVFQSVQSDDTPNGEWIEAQMIYSWSESNWLFEINNAARWFYGWESSTVKSQRLKDHVLDVYVLAPASPPSSSSSSASADSPESLQVVASTTSPSFQLISFRRATDDAMLALSATHHVRQQLQSGHGLTPSQGLTSDHGLTHTVERAAESHVHPHHPSHPMVMQPRPSAPPLLSSAAPLRSSAAAPPRGMPMAAPLPSLRPGFSVAQPLPMARPPQRPPQWTAPPLAMAPRTHSFPSAAPMSLSSHSAWRPPQQSQLQSQLQPQPQPQARPLASAVAVAVPRVLGAAATSFGGAAAGGGGGGADKTVWEITNLLGQLHQIALGDTLERVGWMHETFVQQTAAYLSSSSASASASAASSSSSSPKSSIDAERHLRRVLAPLQLDSPSPAFASRKVSSRLLVTLTEFAMWLYFDKPTAESLRSALDEATVSLMDSGWARRRYGRMMFWLHDHIGQFLHLRFHTTIRDVLLECQELGFQIQYESRSPKTVAAPLSGTQRAKKGQDVFVAQVRELLVHKQTEKRRVRRKLDHQATSISLQFHPHGAVALHRQFNGQWSCSMDQVTLRRARLQPTPSRPTAHSPDLSLLSLVWFWRQFSELTIALSDADASGACRLDATSLFQSPPLGSNFVLDGKDRFLRAFPGGESTLALDVGRYAFGDYVGQYSSAVGEVQLHLYSFLAPTKLASSDDEAPLESIAGDACYCYHVRLIGTPAATLVANVTVKRAQLDVDTLRRVGYASARVLLEEMVTWTLQQKLSAVRAFEDLYHVDLAYHQKGGKLQV